MSHQIDPADVARRPGGIQVQFVRSRLQRLEAALYSPIHLQPVRPAAWSQHRIEEQQQLPRTRQIYRPNRHHDTSCLTASLIFEFKVDLPEKLRDFGGTLGG